jgi:hypothetical protein
VPNRPLAGRIDSSSGTLSLFRYSLYKALTEADFIGEMFILKKSPMHEFGSGAKLY